VKLVFPGSCRRCFSGKMTHTVAIVLPDIPLKGLACPITLNPAIGDGPGSSLNSFLVGIQFIVRQGLMWPVNGMFE
jgi:hypothetical protein